MKKQVKPIVWGLVICTVLGIGLMIGGVYAIIDNENFKKYTLETEAIVTKIDEHTGSDGDSHYYVIVTFSVNGTEYTGDLGYYPKIAMKGDRINIRYDPENPQKFRYNGVSYDGLIMVPAGAAFFIIGMVLYRWHKREPKPNTEAAFS